MIFWINSASVNLSVWLCLQISLETDYINDKCTVPIINFVVELTTYVYLYRQDIVVWWLVSWCVNHVKQDFGVVKDSMVRKTGGELLENE